ncbi:MAG: MarC family protein [Nitrososphaeria archaeon]
MQNKSERTGGIRLIIINRKYVYIILFLLLLVSVKVGISGANSLLVVPSPMNIAITSIQLFAIMDPFGALPLYLYFLGKLEKEERGALWTTVVVSMFVLLVFFAMVGENLLRLFGVSIYSFMIGGGVLLMILAIDTMGEGSRSLSLDPREAAVFPLASPLLVGPGTVATLIILANTLPLSALLISIAVVSAVSSFILKFSEAILRVFGKNGLTAFSRLFSIIIAGFAAQLIYEGLVGWGLIR